MKMTIIWVLSIFVFWILVGLLLQWTIGWRASYPLSQKEALHFIYVVIITPAILIFEFLFGLVDKFYLHQYEWLSLRSFLLIFLPFILLCIVLFLIFKRIRKNEMEDEMEENTKLFIRRKYRSWLLSFEFITEDNLSDIHSMWVMVVDNKKIIGSIRVTVETQEQKRALMNDPNRPTDLHFECHIKS